MSNDSLASASTDQYVKIPNFPGLYRYLPIGNYYVVKKLRGKRREISLRTSDRKVAERRMSEWVRDLSKIDLGAERITLRQLVGKFLALNRGKPDGLESGASSIVF